MAEARWFGGTFQLPSGVITDDNVASGAALDADKMQHLYKPYTNFDLAIGATPVAREEIVFTASTSGTIRAFHCLLNDTGTSTDVDFDLNVNGSSVLSAVVTITNGDSDGAVSDGTISSATLAADDIVSISLAVNSSTGAQGPFAWVEIQETAG